MEGTMVTDEFWRTVDTREQSLKCVWYGFLRNKKGRKCRF